MKLRVLIVCASVIMLLSGCGQIGNSAETMKPPEASEPTSVSWTELPDTLLAATEVSTTQLPIPEGALLLSVDELRGLEELFTQSFATEDGSHPMTNWYNMALNNYYENPQQLNLWSFFSEGVGGPEELSYRPSDAEMEFLKTQPQIQTHLSVHRISETDMTDVLQRYFGFSLDEMDGVGLDRMAHDPETGYYYCSKGGTMFVEELVFLVGYYLDNGDICINYSGNGQECVLVLRPAAEGYQIISNTIRSAS